MSRAAWVLALLLLAWLPRPAVAHEMSMAEMQLREQAPGKFIWQWSAVNDKRPMGNDLRLVWPEGCISEPNALRCSNGLRGRLAVEGLGNRYSAAIIRITWLDGQTRVHTLTARQQQVQLFGTADDDRGVGEIASAYVVLGVEHILGGFDHLMFVIALLFLVGFNKRLVLTITAFTAAHSLTLASSALGWLTLRGPPVEATIALSILLVVGEAMHARPTLARRWPALVAFLFGLVHGLGFAGALNDIGLPQQHLPVALLSFNVGVELGQLAVVALAFALWKVGARLAGLQRMRVPALYAMGSVAAFWSIERVLAVLSP
ncbi:MAG: HupE/UreJ family protein [Nevskia sp.]|nr:HupE/UreJ family protein [Nevskia sp.]